MEGIRYLPPVSLEVAIPPLYPLHEAPVLQVSCLWMGRSQREEVRRVLLSQFEETYKGGAGVLYSWVEWLRSGEVLGALGIKLEVELVEEEGDDEEAGEGWQARLLRVCQHNLAREREAFQRSSVLCLICMTEMLGSRFSALHCGHYWCRDCLSSMARVHISDGSVLSLRCPDPDCGESLTPDVVKELVDPQEFERWERLLLQKVRPGPGVSLLGAAGGWLADWRVLACCVRMWRGLPLWVCVFGCQTLDKMVSRHHDHEDQEPLLRYCW